MSLASARRLRPFALPRSMVRAHDLWRSLIAGLTDPYRPERHYMRGPGPKWHAKHAGAGMGAPER